MADKTRTQCAEIDDSSDVLQRITNLYYNDDLSDVTLVAQGAKIPAHKVILSASSSYFRALFSNGFAESSQKEIELQVPLEAFKLILKYIYTGRLSFVGLNEDQMIDVYDLANQYDFESVKGTIIGHFNRIISVENVLSMLAYVKHHDKLKEACLKFIDRNSIEIMRHDTFKTLPQDLLCDLLARDTFHAPEIDIFNSIKTWYDSNPTADVKAVLTNLRWSLLTVDELRGTVFPSGVLDKMQMFAFSKQYRSLNATPRYACAPCNDLEEVNIATAQYNAETISGINPQFLLNGEFKIDGDATYHMINQHMIYGITVRLGQISLINHIKLLLRYDDRWYSYRVSTSVDGHTYNDVVDYSQYKCRSWQNLYFESRLVEYIRLIGTKSYHYDVPGHDFFNGSLFEVVGLQAMQKEKIPKIINGIVKPTSNVATIDMGATVFEGSSINMFNKNPDEFTCHGIGNGSIIVRLSQPYVIGSLRLLLGNRKYHPDLSSFYIQTSTNDKNWKTVVDKRNESMESSWYHFEFEEHPVTSIKLIGTKSDFNALIVTHFECPSSQQKLN